MVQIFEAIMLVCFGISWPISVYKDIKSRTAKGKSIVFICAIIVGYISGIAGKLSGFFLDGSEITYVFYLYILNLCVVTADLVITIINTKRDKLAEAREAEKNA